MKIEALDLALSIGSRTLCAASRFAVDAGEFWCVLGRNGAGKTTLLRTLAGLRAPDGGRVLLDGRAIDQWRARELAQRRTYMAQQTRDTFSASVLEVVLGAAYAQRGAARLSSWFDSTEERRRALAVLEELDLAAFAARDVLSLSGGERQRVALAATLMQDTELLLLDEPLAHLDIDMQLAVLQHLSARLARGGRLAAVVLSVHDINLAARFASHALLFGPQATLDAGPANQVLSEQSLSLAFRHPVQQLREGERTWFVAQ
jgi:iron complex transport system ATP-binding protein